MDEREARRAASLELALKNASSPRHVIVRDPEWRSWPPVPPEPAPEKRIAAMSQREFAEWCDAGRPAPADASRPTDAMIRG